MRHLPLALWLLPLMPAADYESFSAEVSGVYFVRSPLGKVLYVGITTQSFRSRWAKHHRLGQAIAADASVSFWAVDRSALAHFNC